MFKRVFLVVLDSLGIGHAEDAKAFGDEGSNTLKSVMIGKPFLPNLTNLGLFNIKRAGLEEFSAPSPKGCFGYAKELSNGKDTTVGHWEIAGLVSEKALPTYPNGFPKEVIDEFCRENNVEILCNLPYSGTEVINDYGDEHVKTKKLIIYTSADSVFQIAAHEDIIPLNQLYSICQSARSILRDEHAVGRVIARPFLGESGNYYRTGNRHDYSLEPTGETMLDKLKSNGFDVISIGKINDIFAGKGITESFPTKGNEDGEKLFLDMQHRDFNGLCFVNLVDFDSKYGHRNDIDGYAKALSHFDNTLGEFLDNMQNDDLLIITADHGCDPGTESTDHSRENTPIIAYAKDIISCDLGGFDGFACIAKTICENFGLKESYVGKSFFENINARGQMPC